MIYEVYCRGEGLVTQAVVPYDRTSAIKVAAKIMRESADPDEIQILVVNKQTNTTMHDLRATNRARREANLKPLKEE